MITLILIALIICALVAYLRFCDKLTLSKLHCFTENSVVKKFNRLLKQVSGDNFSTIKEKLLSTLEEYRAIKIAQFTDDRTNLTEAIDAVNTQIASMNASISEKKRFVHSRYSIISPEEGARYMYEIDVLKDTYDRLSNARDNLSAKLTVLDTMISQFEGSLTLRRAQIVSMIAESMSINDNSFIDLRLDSLEEQFKHEVNKVENRKKVEELAGKSTSDKLQFDVEKYKKAFAEFKV